MNKSIHKTHIHLIIFQLHELFPHMTLPQLQNNWEWTNGSGTISSMSKRNTHTHTQEVLKMKFWSLSPRLSKHPDSNL